MVPNPKPSPLIFTEGKNMTKETYSLKVLKLLIENGLYKTKGIKSVDTQKAQIKPTKDVLRYIDRSSKLIWRATLDVNNDRIYDNHIVIR